MFIDDLCLIIYIYTTKTYEAMKAVQEIVNTVYKYFKDCNLLLNSDKTKIDWLYKEKEWNTT